MTERVLIKHPCQNPLRDAFEDIKAVVWKLGDPQMNWEDMDQWEGEGLWLVGRTGACKKYLLTYEQAEKFYGEGSCHLEHYTALGVVK